MCFVASRILYAILTEIWLKEASRVANTDRPWYIAVAIVAVKQAWKLHGKCLQSLLCSILGANDLYTCLSFLFYWDVRCCSRSSILVAIHLINSVGRATCVLHMWQCFIALDAKCDRQWENLAYGTFCESRVWRIFDKLYHRANLRSDFRPIMLRFGATAPCLWWRHTPK